MSHVRIVMTGHGRGEVFVDGEKIDRVRSIQFEAAADRHPRPNTVVLELIPDRVEVEGPGRVVTRSGDPKQLLRQAHNALDYHYYGELRQQISEFLKETPNLYGQLESPACPIAGCERRHPHMHAEEPPAFPPNEPAEGA